MGLYPSFSYTVGTTPAIYCTQTFQPQFLPYLHSGPIPPHFMTQWAYTLIFLHSGHHPRHLLYTDCPTSVPPLLVQWAIPPHFMMQWAYTHLFTYTMGTTLAIYCTQTVQPHFLPYLQNGPIPPIYDTVGLYLLILGPYLHTDTVGLYLLIYTLCTTLAIYCSDCPASVPPLLTQWAHTF